MIKCEKMSLLVCVSMLVQLVGCSLWPYGLIARSLSLSFDLCVCGLVMWRRRRWCNELHIQPPPPLSNTRWPLKSHHILPSRTPVPVWFESMLLLTFFHHFNVHFDSFYAHKSSPMFLLSIKSFFFWHYMFFSALLLRRKLICNCFDYQIIILVVFFKRQWQIFSGCSFLDAKDLKLCCVIVSKLNIFGFWTVDWTF